MNFRYAAVVALSLAALCASAADVGPSAAGASASAASTPAQTASGPTPFPKDAKDWPGKGAIRVFGYMNEYRNSYWRERERKQGSVVFVGDSLVGGWQSLAEDLPGVPVANRGIGGEPTRVLLFRFKEDVLDLHPKAIVLLSGTNDLSAQQDIAQTRSNLVEMLAMAERAAPGVPVVLCTLPPRNAAQAPIDPNRLIELNKLISSLADERANIIVLDLYALVADPDGSPHAEYFGADKLHLSRAGQKRWRDALLPILKRFNLG
jgi:lysophospholipase L1-like esterase